MPLTWSSNAQQLTSISEPSWNPAGSTMTISLSTQGFANGGAVYYSTTGSVIQLNGTAVVNNYLGDLGTAAVSINQARISSTGFTITFYTGSLTGIQISNPVQYSFNPVDQYFTATVLLLSPSGTGTTAFSDLSGTTATSMVGSPRARSFIPFTTPKISSSIYFNGTTDFLTAPNNSAYKFGTGDFTIEFWWYLNQAFTAGQGPAIGQNLNPDGNGGWVIYRNTTVNTDRISLRLLGQSGAGSTDYPTTIVPSQNVWQHWAVVRIGTTVTWYCNGVACGVYTGVSTNVTDTDTTAPMNVGFAPNWGYYNHDSYISNLRIVKGLGVYTGAFTRPTSPLQTTQAAGTNIAAITTQTVLLLAQAAQAPNNNSFYDSANTLTQISYVGTPTSGTFSPFFQPYATYFNASGTLTTDVNANFQFGTGQFTIELWLYLLATPTANIQIAGVQSTGGIALYIATNGTLSMNLNGTGDILTSTYTPPLRTWVHLAISRNNANAIGIFAAGARINSTTNGGTYNGSTGFKVGGFGECYIANLRVTKGSYLYDAGSASPYTPPTLTTPLAATAQTVLLACQLGTSSNFDVSTYRNTLTQSGSVITQSISTTTFLTDSYSASADIGSIYFRTTDALQIATTATFVFGTGDFTIEAWIYPNSSSNGVILDTRSGPSGLTPVFYLNSGQLSYYVNGADKINSPITLAVNTWHHVALARSSGNTRMFLNGLQTSSTYAVSDNFILTNNNYIGGRDNGGNNTGILYISNFRLIKGYGAYTGNFYPPLTPVTASLTGTTTIINGNDSAIYDSSGNHNIATIGTATINSSVVKYGSSSIKILPTTNYLSITTSSNALLQFGSGPFTVEAWIQVLATTGIKVIYDNRNPDTVNLGFCFEVNSSNNLNLGTNGTNWITGSTVLTNGLWYHVAVVRESATVTKLYLNGNQEGSTFTGNPTFTNYLTRIGFGVNGTFNGYISDLRVSRFARYTAAFTTATTFNPLT